MYGFVAECRHTLSNFALVVRKHQVHAAAVYVELLAEVFGAHGRTFHVPTGETFAPRTRPVHDVLGRGFFPQRKIDAASFLRLTIEFTCCFEQLVDIPPRQFAVVVVAVVFLDIEIDRPFADVGVTRIENLLHKCNLFDDVPRCVRLDARRQHVQSLHRLVVTQRIVLDNLHRLEFFEACFFGYFVFALVGIVLQMSHIGDVAHIAYFVAEMRQITIQNIERDGRPRVPEMTVAIDRRTANVQPDMRRVQRFEQLFAMRQCIVNKKRVFHKKLCYKSTYKVSNFCDMLQMVVFFVRFLQRFGCLKHHYL